MKHLGFTVRFLVLLVSVPLLMYVELTRKTTEKTEQPKDAQTEMVVSAKSSVATDSFLVVVK